MLAPWDTEAHQEEMACAQSCCAIAICAALLIAEVDGLVRGWRGKIACDPLREPRTGRYDAIMFLEHLSRQRGLFASASGRCPPEVRAVIVLQIEGPEHVLMATVDGRKVRYSFDAGALPCCGEGMPWERLGFRL